MNMQDIERKIRLMREMQRMAEEAQAEADSIKDEIKAYMGASETLSVGEYKNNLQDRKRQQARRYGAQKGDAGHILGVLPSDGDPPFLCGVRRHTMTDREILLNEIKRLLEDASNHELDFVYVMLLNMRRDTQ